MTDPYYQQPDRGQPYGYPGGYQQPGIQQPGFQQPGFQPGGYPPGVPGPAYPGGFPGPTPGAPYGVDPVTGLPYSDKSKIAAGLLQLFFGHLGVGRFYIGSTTIGLIQLCVFLVSIPLCLVVIGFFTWAALGLWAFIDAIMMFTGSVRDGHGRPLRP